MEYKVFFCYLKMFSIFTSMPLGLQWDPRIYSRFKNKIVLVIFQLLQLWDSECHEIFEITEYNYYFGSNTSWQYSSPGLNFYFAIDSWRIQTSHHSIKLDRMFLMVWLNKCTFWLTSIENLLSQKNWLNDLQIRSAFSFSLCQVSLS